MNGDNIDDYDNTGYDFDMLNMKNNNSSLFDAETKNTRTLDIESDSDWEYFKTQFKVLPLFMIYIMEVNLAVIILMALDLFKSYIPLYTILSARLTAFQMALIPAMLVVLAVIIVKKLLEITEEKYFSFIQKKYPVDNSILKQRKKREDF